MPSTEPQFRVERSQECVDEGISLAPTCTFEPDTRFGEPVAAWGQVDLALQPR